MRLLVPALLLPSLLFPLSACGGERTETDTARDAAASVLDSFASGDYGPAWDGLDDEAHGLISRAEWIRLHTVLCRPAGEGRAFEIRKVRVDGQAGTGTVMVFRQGMIFTWPLVREHGGWRVKLEAEQAKGYRVYTPEELAASWADMGLCQQDPAAGDDDEDELDLDLHIAPRRSSSTRAPSASPRKTLPAVKAPAPVRQQPLVRQQAPRVQAPAPAVRQQPAAKALAPRVR